MTGALSPSDVSSGDQPAPLLVPAAPLPQPLLSLGDLTLHLTQLGLTAPDLGSAMSPVLNVLVERTSAVGAGYFQLRDTTLTYHARAASGVMPQGPAMDALLATVCLTICRSCRRWRLPLGRSFLTIRVCNPSRQAFQTWECLP